MGGTKVTLGVLTWEGAKVTLGVLTWEGTKVTLGYQMAYSYTMCPMHLQISSEATYLSSEATCSQERGGPKPAGFTVI